MSTRRRWHPDELRTLIGAEASADVARGDDTRGRVKVAQGDPWRRAPDTVHAAFANDECGEGTERFRRHHALVGACKDAGFDLARTVAIVEQFPPSIEKFGWRSGGVDKAVNDSWEALGRSSTPTHRTEADGDLGLISMADVQETKVEWIWYGWLPLGKIVTMDGDPGVAKSTLALTIAAHITSGREWPDGSPCPEGSVIVMSAEDDLDDTVKPRLRLAGAKMERVFAFDEVRDDDGRTRLPNLGDVEELRARIKRTGAKLVVVDVFMSYVPTKSDSHKDQDVRGFLHPLKKLATDTGCSFLMLRHLNKSGGGNAKSRGGGSIGISGASRAVWTVGEDREQNGVRVLSSAKVNNAPKPGSLQYTLDFDEDSETGRIRWLGGSALSADDLVAENSVKESPSQRSEAEAKIIELLTEADGWMASVEFNEAMTEAGFKPATVSRARKELGIVPRKDPAMDGRWGVSLPAHPRTGG